jgi:hypothetical protein
MADAAARALLGLRRGVSHRWRARGEGETVMDALARHGVELGGRIMSTRPSADVAENGRRRLDRGGTFLLQPLPLVPVANAVLPND